MRVRKLNRLRHECLKILFNTAVSDNDKTLAKVVDMKSCCIDENCLKGKLKLKTIKELSFVVDPLVYVGAIAQHPLEPTRFHITPIGVHEYTSKKYLNYNIDSRQKRNNLLISILSLGAHIFFNALIVLLMILGLNQDIFGLKTKILEWLS